MTELQNKVAKLDKARQFAGHQAAQARKQIEKLQTDLATQQRSAARVQPPAPPKAPVQSLDLVLSEGDEAAGLSSTERSTLPANGFADTLPMPVIGAA